LQGEEIIEAKKKIRGASAALGMTEKNETCKEKDPGFHAPQTPL
jgi:hypothetical protein